MSDGVTEFPTSPHGPPQAADEVVRAWRERGFGNHPGDAPTEELPRIGEHLGSVGFTVRELEYDTEDDAVRLVYRRPDGLPPDRGVEIVASAFIAAADRAPEWNDTDVVARDGDITWEIDGHRHDLTGAGMDRPWTLVKSVLQHWVEKDLEETDEAPS